VIQGARLAFVLLVVVGCGSTDPASTTDSPPGPDSQPATQPGTDPATSTDPGKDPTTEPQKCARADLAKTAPIALWDAFQKDMQSLTGAARQTRADQLLADVAAQGGAPLEDPAGDRVVFVSKSAKYALGAFAGWDKSKAVALTAVSDTDLAAGETHVARGTSYEYKLLTTLDDGGFVEDPLAKNVVWDGIDRGFGVRGEFNAIIHPQDLPKDKGRLVSLGKVHATKLANDRDVWVYFPASYDDATGKCAKLPSIVFHDGRESLTRGAFMNVADDLYAKRPELSAVIAFVDLPNQDVRMDEYTFDTATAKGAEYVDFVTAELWPRLAKEDRLCSKAGARGISGASLGGLISTFAAFEKPNDWGWVGAQSASYFWQDDAMIKRVQSTPKIATRFYLDSGCPDDNCVVTDEMDQVMSQKGYDHVRIKVQDAQHDWSYWRDRLPGLLTHFRDKQNVCD